MPHSVIPSIEQDSLKIAVLGAAGGIGQSLSLLLKAQLQYQLKESNRTVTHIHLALYDVNQEAINGVTADSVSYTHLDVYKRQSIYLAGRLFGWYLSQNGFCYPLNGFFTRKRRNVLSKSEKKKSMIWASRSG